LAQHGGFLGKRHPGNTLHATAATLIIGRPRIPGILCRVTTVADGFALRYPSPPVPACDKRTAIAAQTLRFQ